jgi:hypothetical protein
MTLIQEAVQLLLACIQILDKQTGRERGEEDDAPTPSEALYAALAIVSVHGQVCHHLLEQLSQSTPPERILKAMAAEQAVDWLEGGKALPLIVTSTLESFADGAPVYQMGLEDATPICPHGLFLKDDCPECEDVN